MKLTQLELAGFKSFVDTTKFSFSEGLTGIIGPNGCGKSNIADAIHWVLGEQNPRKLRGNSMKDVIFKGTRKRAQYNFTEVSITIDNDKKILPIEYDNVKITRKVYLDGENEYRINNNSCRLKDIHNLFYDTGIGQRAYSFMEQKMIDEILSGNDEEKRYLFEEAAGIMKYNQSKKASENKLNAIKNDLIRLDDIITEVKHQVGTLRHQVGKAKKFQNLKQKINKIQTQLAGIKYFNLNKQLTSILNESLTIEKKLTEITKIISKNNQSFQKKNNELLGIEKKLKDEQYKQKNIENKINNYEKEILLNRQQISNSKSTLSENLKRIENIKSQNISTKKNLEKDIILLDKAKEKLFAQNENAKYLENQLKNITKKISALNQDLDVINNKINTLTNTKQELLQKQSESNTRKKILSEQISILQNKIKEYKTKSDDISTQIIKSKKSEDIHTSELHHFLKKKSILEAEIHKLNEIETDLQQQVNTTELQIKSLSNEAKQLGEWEKNLTDYEEGTKKIINHFSEKMDISLFAKQISVDDNYIPLIENSLKHILTSIVCNKKEIDEILSLLQNEGINSNIILKYPENIPEEHRNPAKNNYESAIPLYNVIKNSNNINPKIFQNIYIVQKRQTAQKLAWENNDSPAELHFITQDGEIFTSYGRIKTNWYEQSTNKLLSRKNVIENLQKDIQKKSRIINDIKEKIENIASEKLEKNNLLNSLSKKIEVLKNILEDDKKTNIKRTLQLENLINLQNEYDNNLIKIQKELNDIEAHLKEIEIQLLTLPNINIDELIKKQEILTGKLQKMKNSKYQIENKFHNTQIEIAKLKKDDYFISEKIKKNEMIVNDNEDILTKSEKSIIPMKEEISKSEKLTDNIEIKFRQEIDNLNKYKTIVLKTENQFRILRSENEKIKLNLHELEFRKDALTKDKNNIELKSQEIKLTLNHIKDDVISHFHHDLTHDDPEDCLDLDSHNLTDEISKNQKSLENLGPINLSAIDDYKTQKERLKFLKEQREDLIHSQNNLRMAITQLNDTAEKMFLETFNQIQQNFQKIFKEVFNGGRGILRLQDKSQPLDSKIEILSNPKGKKISNINLLSSGEKALTAITLIFSIYLVKPSPFCILDEIDAPLDDANINRFLVLLNKFSKDTQFIIISHNKRTIEEVDYLYGITMEEDGVSKIVSVEFT